MASDAVERLVATNPLAALDVRVRQIAVTAPAIAAVVGVLALAIDVRGGLLAAAFIIGWSQLAGL